MGLARAARPGAVRGGGLSVPHIDIRLDDLSGGQAGTTSAIAKAETPSPRPV